MSKILDRLKAAEAQRAAPEHDRTRLADERAAAEAAARRAQAETKTAELAAMREVAAKEALRVAREREASESIAVIAAQKSAASEAAAAASAEGRARAEASALKAAQARESEAGKALAAAQAQAAARTNAEEPAGEDVERAPSPDRRPWTYSVVALLAAFGVGFLASQNFSRKETPVAEARPAAPAPAGSFALKLDRDVEGFAARLKAAGRK